MQPPALDPGLGDALPHPREITSHLAERLSREPYVVEGLQAAVRLSHHQQPHIAALCCEPVPYCLRLTLMAHILRMTAVLQDNCDGRVKLQTMLQVLLDIPGTSE